MAQLARSTSLGSTVDSPAQIHGLIDGARILPGAINEQTETSVIGGGDYALIYQAATQSLRKIRLDTLVFSSGDVIPTAAISVTGSWLICDGQQYLQSAYPSLFAAIGSTYGIADAGYFRVPDLRGRGIVGLDSSVGGLFADRITNNGTGNPNVNSRTLGAAGGVDRLALTLGQMPSHPHQTNAFGLSNNTETGGNATRIPGYSQANTNYGGNEAHPNLGPSLVLNFKIKT